MLPSTRVTVAGHSSTWRTADGPECSRLQRGTGHWFCCPIKQVNEALTEMLSVERITGLWFGAKVDASSHPPRLLEVHPESPAYQAGLRKRTNSLRLMGRHLMESLIGSRE